MIDLSWIKKIFAQDQRYQGIANPSGAVALSTDRFVVADDELNQLLIYDPNSPQKALQTIYLSEVFPGAIQDGEDLEIDMESAAGINGTYFWLGSHSTSKKGKDRPARRRLFALTLRPSASGQFEAAPAGAIYTHLLEDLQRDGQFDRYRLDKARGIPPKAIGGLSIEGMAATPQQTLLIGFRNPLAGGEIKQDRLLNAKALVVELLNPFEVIEGATGKFAAPLELDLDGYGIRDIAWRRQQDYLIVAGPYHDNVETEEHKREKFRLYQWSKTANALKLFKAIDLDSLNVEAAFFMPGDEDHPILLSDDGKLGKGKRFRSRRVTLE